MEAEGRLNVGERSWVATSKQQAEELRVMQINLDHTKRALTAMTRRMEEVDICIAAINYPPCTKKARPQLPPEFMYFGEQKEPLSAIVVRRPNFDVFPVHISRCVVAVRCTRRERTWLVVAAYGPPHSSMDPTLDALAACIEKERAQDVLVMGDLNAKHAIRHHQRRHAGHHEIMPKDTRYPNQTFARRRSAGCVDRTPLGKVTHPARRGAWPVTAPRRSDRPRGACWRPPLGRRAPRSAPVIAPAVCGRNDRTPSPLEHTRVSPSV
ncbi:hypothetical protein HPB49_012601 [Dermacentor silvarum]|uniref:Uncharacterized protein n=1 Tax=Dermacentor silvarum TaxID=543639 RepID=A0ACB8C3R7_DERSI|nr:hypothetical protein HPB49_012601 [Dermacentor silvarum]